MADDQAKRPPAGRDGWHWRVRSLLLDLRELAETYRADLEATIAVRRAVSAVLASTSLEKPFRSVVKTAVLRRIARAPARVKGRALAVLAKKGRIDDLFRPDAASRPRALAHALTTRSRRAVSENFPKLLKPLFGSEAFSLEGIQYPGGRDVFVPRVHPQALTTDEIAAGSPHRVARLEIYQARTTTSMDIPAVLGPVFVPVSPVFPGAEALRVTDQEGARPVTVTAGRYSYLRLDKPSTLAADRPVVVGAPMPIRRRKRALPRLAMSIFVDGLSAEVFQHESFAALMPNTRAFFERGFVTLDARSAAEWTLPSVASISTGVRPHVHRVCHRNRFPSVSAPKAPHLYFPKVMQDLGFVTAQFCANWRRSGSYGYLSGFDRTLTARGFYPAEAVVADALEHLTVFRDTHQYLWLTFFDLHHDHGGTPEFMVRAAGQPEDAPSDDEVKSVFKGRDDARTAWYLAKIRRLDLMFAGLFAFLERNWSDDEMVIGLFSDHGVSFMGTETDHRFRRLMDSRVKVPMMFRGRGTETIPANRPAVNLDHFPTLMSSFAPVTAAMLDGRRLDAVDLTREARTATISETLFPGQTYALRVEAGSRVFLANGGRISPNLRVDVSSLTFFEQKRKGWVKRDVSAMPPAMLDALADHGYKRELTGTP